MYKVTNLTNGQKVSVKPNFEQHVHCQNTSCLWCLNPVHVKPVCVFVEPFCPCQLPINFAFDSSWIKVYLKWYHNFADFHFISLPENWPNIHQNLQVLGGSEHVAATIRKKFAFPDLSYPSLKIIHVHPTTVLGVQDSCSATMSEVADIGLREKMSIFGLADS